MNMTGASFNSVETIDVKHTLATAEEDNSQIKEANLTLASAPQQGAVNTKYYALTQVLDNGVTSASDLVSNITSTTSITPVTILNGILTLAMLFIIRAIQVVVAAPILLLMLAIPSMLKWRLISAQLTPLLAMFRQAAFLSN
ncbi:MAG: hypothetical protein IPH82_29480, partial [Chloroflexi bacterium]|nr:hypothetical protein [Chloroflexota bacterium]